MMMVAFQHVVALCLQPDGVKSVYHSLTKRVASQTLSVTPVQRDEGAGTDAKAEDTSICYESCDVSE